MNQNPNVPTTTTESGRAEEISGESAAHLSALINQTLSGIAETDTQGTFLLVNERYCAITGYAQDELIGIRRMQELTHPDDLHGNQELFARCVSEGIPFETEKRYLRKDGSTVWVNNSVSAIRGNDGSIQSLLAVTLDITKRRQAEEGLRASEERYRQLVEQAVDGIFLADATGRYLDANSAGLQMVGYTLEELRRLTVNDLIVPQELPRMPEQFTKLGTGDVVVSEWRFRRKDGSTFIGEVVGRRFPDGHLLGILRDVTARRQIEDDLRSSQSTLAAALASMTDAVFISDTQGRFIEFNEAFATFHKFRNKDECARTLQEYPLFLDVYFPNGEPVPFEQWAVPRALRGESDVNAEYHLRRKDTGESWIGSYNFAPIRDQHNQIVGSVVVGRDITMEKQAQQELHDSQRRLASLFQHAQNAILLADDEARYLDANPAACLLTGFSREELLQKNVWDLTPAPEKVRGLQMWEEFIHSGQQVGEYPLKCKDGTLRTVHFRAVANILPGLHLSILHDISAEKQVQVALQESETRIKSIVDSAMDAIVTIDEQQNIVLFNPAAEQMFQCTANEIVGQTLDRFLPPRFRDTHRQHHTKFGQDNITQRGMNGFGTVYGLRANGEEFPLEASISKANVNGTKLFTAILRDITERTISESVLQQTLKELAEANAALINKENERRDLIQRLIGVQEEERQRLSLELHDQTAQHLAALRMMLVMLEDPAPSNPEQNELLAKAQQLTEQLGKELRTLAWELRPTHLQESGLAVSLESYVKEWSARCGIPAAFHFRGESQRRFSALQEITVYRVIQEALTNVLKYAQARQVTVALEYFPERLRAVVEDDGVGFVPEELNERNTGLGLRGMRERLALVDGALEIESTPGRGTALYLNLTLAPHVP